MANNEQSRRTPILPDPRVVEALVQAISEAILQFCQAHEGVSVSDILSAVFTYTHRVVRMVVYDQPLTDAERWDIRRTVIGGIERLWSFAAGMADPNRVH